MCTFKVKYKNMSL